MVKNMELVRSQNGDVRITVAEKAELLAAARLINNVAAERAASEKNKSDLLSAARHIKKAELYEKNANRLTMREKINRFFYGYAIGFALGGIIGLVDYFSGHNNHPLIDALVSGVPPGLTMLALSKPSKIFEDITGTLLSRAKTNREISDEILSCAKGILPKIPRKEQKQMRRIVSKEVRYMVHRRLC